MKIYLFKETFNATAPLRVDSIALKWEHDDNPDLSWLEQDYSDCSPAEAAKYRQQDKDRLAAYNRGDWYMQGCFAVAEVSYSIGQGSRRIEKFTSGALWGIESDCGDDYRKQVEQEQLDDLKEHLAQFNIPWPVIPELVPA